MSNYKTSGEFRRGTGTFAATDRYPFCNLAMRLYGTFNAYTVATDAIGCYSISIESSNLFCHGLLPYIFGSSLFSLTHSLLETL
jgi:hypothetical protein